MGAHSDLSVDVETYVSDFKLQKGEQVIFTLRCTNKRWLNPLVVVILTVLTFGLYWLFSCKKVKTIVLTNKRVMECLSKRNGQSNSSQSECSYNLDDLVCYQHETAKKNSSTVRLFFNKNPSKNANMLREVMMGIVLCTEQDILGFLQHLNNVYSACCELKNANADNQPAPKHTVIAPQPLIASTHVPAPARHVPALALAPVPVPAPERKNTFAVLPPLKSTAILSSAHTSTTPAHLLVGSSTGAMAFTLTSETTAAAAPFCIGFTFKIGDIPKGQGVVGNLSHMQVIPRNLYPDGSLRFALVAGRAALTANTLLTVTLSAGTPASGTTLTLTNLKATGVTASIACGSFGTVSWATTDWDSPFESWVSGSELSSWVYRKPVGSDPFLVGWLEVRLYADSSVEVLPWIENGYISVPNATNKVAVYQFTLGGTQRFNESIDLPARARTPLIDGAMLSHWLTTDPGVLARHDVDYMQATEIVPTYRAQVDASSDLVAGLVTTYTPLQQGNFDYSLDVMDSTGYASPIGPLPQHDILYLCSDNMSIGASIQRNGYSAGRYGIHYRDEATNKPLRFSQHPYTSTNYSSSGDYPTVPTGTTTPQWDAAHHPSVGYMAYLLTGRYLFMEQVQFAATTNYINQTDGQRFGTKGIFEPMPGAVQVRQVAWDFRTLIHTLIVTPDYDTVMQGEFVASVEANIDQFYAKYIAQPNHPNGFIRESFDYSINYGPVSQAAAAGYMGSPWMQDFVTGVWGWAQALNMPISALSQTKLAAFFQWKAKSIVSRWGPSDSPGNYWYINGSPYNLCISPSHFPDWDTGSGPWFSDWNEAYQATKAVAVTGQLGLFGTTEGMLCADALPGANAMLGNLQPAMAYAVRHNVPGAADAYNRLVTATNWPALNDMFTICPVWSVMPPGFPK